MLSRTIVGVLAARLVLAPWAVADPGDGASPIRDSAAREAARVAPAQTRGPMRPGFKWGGIGLIAGGTALAIGGTLATGEGCATGSDFACRDYRAAAHVGGGLMAGTGALLLAIGQAKREPASPAIAWQDEARLARVRDDSKTRRGPLPKGLKWTGIGLLLAGSMTTLTAALGNCGAHECDKGTGIAVGGAEIVAGSMLLAIADRHRLPAAPSLIVLPKGGAMIRQRITF